MLDCFIERVFESNQNLGLPYPILIGLALEEQIVAVDLPMDKHDR